MSLNKVIALQVSTITKATTRLELAIEKAEDKLIDLVITKVEKEIPFELPFNVREVVKKGEELDKEEIKETLQQYKERAKEEAKPSKENIREKSSSLQSQILTPSNFSRVPQLSNTSKQKIEKSLSIIETTVNTTIQINNQLLLALNTVSKPLNTLENLSTGLQATVISLQAISEIITTLPIPTGAPVGVGVPASLLTGLASKLDDLDKNTDKLGGAVDSISEVSGEINKVIKPVQEKLQKLGQILPPILLVISFIRIFLKYGSNPTSEQIEEEYNETLTTSQNAINSSGNNSNEEINQTKEELLLSQLQSNSNDPLYYKGYRLVIEYEPKNRFSFPYRRLKGRNKESKIILYNTENGVYSYSSSVQVLINEIKFRIDNYITGKEGFI